MHFYPFTRQYLCKPTCKDYLKQIHYSSKTSLQQTLICRFVPYGSDMFGEKMDLRAKTTVIVALVVAGVFLGYVYVNASGKGTSTIVVQYDMKEGVVIGVGESLGPEEREEIMVFAIEKVVEDEEIDVLLAGREYSVEATIHGAHTIQDILQNNTLTRSETRIILEGRPVVTVTLTFPDGSGYNVQVDISDWSLGEPVYSEEVAPPTLLREVVDRALNRTVIP